MSDLTFVVACCPECGQEGKALRVVEDGAYVLTCMDCLAEWEES